MTAVEDGDFEEAVRKMNRVLAVRGQVVPASPTPLVLHAALHDGSEVVGQSLIAATSGIERVWLTPDGVRASTDAIAAIAEADLLVIGPGSLFTSVLPSLLLPEIRAAVLASTALRIYVCNVATQPGETTGFDLADHVEALERHTSSGIVDVVLANSRSAGPCRRRAGRRRDPAALAAERRSPAAARPRRPRRPRRPASPRPRPPRRRDHPDRRARRLRPPARRDRRPDRVIGTPVRRPARPAR